MLKDSLSVERSLHTLK